MTQPVVRRGPARHVPRLVVQVAVADPDLAEDCLAAVAACGLAGQRAEVASLVGGCAVLLIDDAAARAAGDTAAAAAWQAATHAFAVCSDLAPARPLGRDALSLPGDTAALLGCLERAATSDSGGRLVVVAGAHGGAGTSTLACAVALAAGQGYGAPTAGSRGGASQEGAGGGGPATETLLVEADPGGPGLDLLLGMEDEPGLRLDAVHVGAGELDGDELWRALPQLGSVAIAARGTDVGGTGLGGAGLVGGAPSGGELDAARLGGCAVARSSALAVARSGVRSGRCVVCDAGRADHADLALLSSADAVALTARATVSGLAQATVALDVLVGVGAVPSAVVVQRRPGDALGGDDVREWWTRNGPTAAASPELLIHRAQRSVATAQDNGRALRLRGGFAAAAVAVLEAAHV